MWAMVACNTLTSLGGRGLWPPPHHQLGRARTLSYAYIIFHHNFKIKFQTHFGIILQVNLSDLCLCTQLATSISP
jgi:hypothetical protein